MIEDCGVCGDYGTVEIVIGNEVFWRCEPCAKKAMAGLAALGADIDHIGWNDNPFSLRLGINESVQ